MTLRVVGIGSRLSTDDGIGLWLVQQLADRRVDAPGCSFELWEDRDALDLAGALLDRAADSFLVVDCADMGLPGGTARLIRPGEAALETGERRHSVHGMGPAFAVELARCCGFEGEVAFFGVQPFDLALAPELSPEMQRRGPALLEALDRAVMRLAGHGGRQ